MYSKMQLKFLLLLYKKELQKNILLTKLNMDPSTFFYFQCDENLLKLYETYEKNGLIFYALNETGRAIVDNYKSELFYTKRGPFILSIMALSVSVISLLVSLN